MSRVDITPAGRQDLFEIWEYIARYNQLAADEVVRKINAAFEVLALFAGAGADRAELGNGLRSYPVKSYLVFYRRTATGIEVVRVLHGARNIARSDFG